ncbi:hypothetical protein ABZ953_39075 [Streptomyces sp. NPDC046465]|uniref:hypothetical protein n=1 Tax=Streptomyces sp. NPDC046465 TaxID=3155810 RepID=UPI0033D3CDC2
MNNENERWYDKLLRFPRGAVLAVLGAITVGVAVLSMAVSYQILDPAFGLWASPTVGALDALWVVLQTTEVLAANNRSRSRRVQWAGLALTAVIAAIPTADLIVSRSNGSFDLAVVLAPVAIVATKSAWWLVLPALGRRVSPATRQAIATRRQDVADRIEQMEADAADRIELLAVARDLEKRVSTAETAYRKATLKGQQNQVEELHEQSRSTVEAITSKPIPPLVANIELPDLDTWSPTAPALPVTPAVLGRHTLGTQVNGPTVPRAVASRGTVGAVLTMADMAAVRGVPTPESGEPLTDAQIGVVLRYLRYQEEPPLSKRQATRRFRNMGFMGSQERLKRVWRAEVSEDNGADDVEENDDDVEEVADDDVTA